MGRHKEPFRLKILQDIRDIRAKGSWIDITVSCWNGIQQRVPFRVSAK